MTEDNFVIEAFINLYATLLYESIEHGDEEHRKWLKDKMDEFTEEWLDKYIRHRNDATSN